MTVLPVVAREMSVMARRKSTYWARTVTGLLALLVMLWLLVVSRAHVSYAQMGGSLFYVLSSICFAFCALVGMQATADSVSEEKREGTLGLLFLTDLRSFDVISGKMAATSLGAVLALFGVIPMLSLALLLGGVTIVQFGLTALVLANTMFFSLSLGVFVSTISENERKAMMGTFAGLAILMMGPALLINLFRARFGMVEQIGLWSPLYAFTAVQNSNPAFGTILPPSFWASVISTHTIAWSLLIAASLILPRYVNVLPPTRFLHLRQWTQNFVYGRIEERKKHRAELLDRNAFLWLASRERAKTRYAWGVIAFFCALYVWMALQFPNMMFDFAVAGGIMFLLHLVFKIWAASEVCSRLIEDRRSGALELLLSTPLSVRQIADGQSKALARLFLKPLALLICLELVLLYFGLRTYGDMASNGDKVLLYTIAISSFLIDLWALKWVGLWLSLKGKSIERVLVATLLRILLLPWAIFAGFAGLMASAFVLQRREPDSGQMLVVWWLISVLISIAFGFASRRRFLAQFRELASRRFDSAVEVEAPIQQKVSRSKTPMPSFHRRHPVTTAVFAALLVILLFAALRGVYWDRRLAAEFQKIRQQGHPVTAQEMLRFAPSPPANQNAFAMLDNSGPVVMTTRRTFPSRNNLTNVTEAELEAFRRLTAGNSAAIKAMWRLPEFPKGSIEVLGNSWMQSYLQSGYMAVVDADLMDTLHREGGPDLNRVERDIFALLAHARLLREQPLSLCQDKAQEALLRLAGALSFVLPRNLLTPDSIEKLLREADQMSRTNMLERTLAVQRGKLIEISTNPNTLAAMGMAVPKTLSLIDSVNMMLGFRDQQLIESLKHYERAIAVAQEPLPERLSHLNSEQYWPKLSWMGFTLFQENLSDLFYKDANYTALLNLIRAALAAKLYQIKYDRLPATLDALVPEFMKRVPIDPYSGEPLRTILTDQLVIYSLGLDRTDNTAVENTTNKWADLRLPVR